jgi:hypothetical protein
MNSLIQLKQTTSVFLVAFGLAWFAVSPAVQAVVPAPDGGYPGHNTAEGQNALFSLTTGGFNTAVGWFSLHGDTTGGGNTANGALALFSNTTGTVNTAVGGIALLSNTTGNDNTAIGIQALQVNTTGGFNTAVGDRSLNQNTTGGGNTAVGLLAGTNVTTANSVICIGSGGGNVNFTTWIDNIFGVTTQNGNALPVVVSVDGQLGTAPSSERFKKNIANMDKTSESILSLRPVTFHYKTDTQGIPQFGLIAEEVAKVNPALVLPDKQGRPYSVRYDAVNAMLLNEFLKEHKAFVEEHRTVEELKKEVAALTAGLQKVSAQIEASKPAPQVVNNP